MGTVESLVRIRDYWNDATLSLYEKACLISEEYYTGSLKLGSTAAYIGITPSELDSLLALSELDDETLKQISEVNPPITTWMMLANASDEELVNALEQLKEDGGRRTLSESESVEERLFAAMVQVAGPTTEQILSTLSCDVIFAMVRRAQSYKTLTPKNLSALKSFGNWRKRGKTLTERQVNYLRSILTQMVDAGVIVRNSTDGDKEMCDVVLDTLGM